MKVTSIRELSLSVRDQEMVEVAGVEPAGVGESTPVNRQLVFGWFIFHQADPKWDRPPATS